MSRLGDRRSWVRFEVLGALGGVVEFTEQATIVDLSRMGMLVASSVAPAVDSRLILRLLLRGEEMSVDARVRHCRVVARANGSQYLVGLEFLSSSPRLERAIDYAVATEAT